MTGDHEEVPGGAAAGIFKKDLAGVPERGAVAAGGAVVEFAGGFAVPAVHGRVSDVHAGNQEPELGVRQAQPDGGDRASVRVDVQRACESVCTGDSVSPEEEKMAVILQRVVGGAHGERFYPDVSEVVRSRNFYPVPPTASEDGIATVALGLGRAVVEGGKCLMFSPRYPRNLVQFSSVHDMLTNSQSEFWAIEWVMRQMTGRRRGKGNTRCATRRKMGRCARWRRRIRRTMTRSMTG